jgi:hypothetical protein
MSKTKENNVKEAEVVEPTVDEKAQEAIKNLQLQLNEHRKQADHHTTMAVKAQGALEVMLQLHPQEENK